MPFFLLLRGSSRPKSDDCFGRETSGDIKNPSKSDKGNIQSLFWGIFVMCRFSFILSAV